VIHTLGAHHGHAGLVAKALRAATRPTPAHWTRRPIDLAAAAATLGNWAALLDLADVDALCWIPGHNRTPGPGHTAAVIIAAATGLPLIDACQRQTATDSACAVGRRHWTHHARTMHIPTRHRRQRLALVDNTVGTGHTALGAIAVLTAAGHQVTHVLAASHAATTQPGSNR